MSFRASEDRLNPVPPTDADEATLGGYAAVYGRSPAFEGEDGQAYTVAVEAEETEDGWGAYLVFLRWSGTGSAIMGHVETDDLGTGESEAGARAVVEAMSLHDVKAMLDRTIEQKRQWAHDD